MQHEHDHEQHIFYITQDSSDELNRKRYLDSECSNHIAKDESMFKDINDSIVESKGKGTIMVETRNGTRFVEYVLLVPNLIF